MNNDLNQIQLFYQVAQCQSFTRAAEVLGVQKSTVSNKIKQLEARLGVKLLQRTTRRVMLTEAGLQYMASCQRVLDELAQAEARIGELQQQAVGHLRIAVPQNFADVVLPKILSPFLQRHPGVTMEVQQGRQECDLIESGLDLAIRASFSPVPDSSLVYRQIYQSRRIFVASPEHVAKFGVAQNIQQLCQQPYIASVAGEHKDESFNQVLIGGRWHTFKARLTVNSMMAITQAVEDGLGFAILPVGMARDKLTSGALVQIASEVPLSDSVISLVYPSRQGQPAKLKAFIDTMLDWGEGMMQKTP